MAEVDASKGWLGPPRSALLPIFDWEGAPTKIDYRKKGYPYSNISTGGPRWGHNWGHCFDCFWGLSKSETGVVSQINLPLSHLG